jgi:hypothetical protein
MGEFLFIGEEGMAGKLRRIWTPEFEAVASPVAIFRQLIQQSAACMSGCPGQVFPPATTKMNAAGPMP